MAASRRFRRRGRPRQVGAAALTPSRSPVIEFGSSVVKAARPVELVDAPAQPALSLNGIEAAQVRAEARIDPATGDRTDALSVGALDGGGPGLRLEVRREGAGRAALSLYVATAETAASAGAAIERLGATRNVATVEGPVEWAELTLAGRARGCAAFRLAPLGAGSMRGVVCGGAGAAIDAAAIACLVEKLSLTKAGREAGYGDLLRAAPRRAPCRTPLG